MAVAAEDEIGGVVVACRIVVVCRVVIVVRGCESWAVSKQCTWVIRKRRIVIGYM